MKQVICNLTDVPAKRKARVFPFFGREVQVWRAGERIRAAAKTCLHPGGPLDCKDGAFVCPWHGSPLLRSGIMFLLTWIEGKELVNVWEEPS